MKKSALLAAALIVVMAFGGCGKSEVTESPNPVVTEDVGTDVPPIEDVAVVGEFSERNEEGLRVGATTEGDTIQVCMDDWKQTAFQAAIDEFNATYPDIQLELKSIQISDDNVMTSLAASKTLPDVIYDFMREMPSWASQGWVYPLDEFIVGDPDFQYIPEDAIEWRTYGGQLYSLPVRAHVNNLIAINTDLMDELNIDMPAVDWSFDDYKEFLRAGTTEQYSGTEGMPGAALVGPALVGTEHNWGYNFETNSFDMTNGWLAGQEWNKEVEAIAGVVASTLRDPLDSTNTDCDYIRKFGEGDIENGNMAWEMGKILSVPCSTADQAGFRKLPFNWEFHSIPQVDGIGTRPAVQGTNTIMCATTKYPEAAFEVAKWFSFGEKGMIAQLDCLAQKDQTDLENGSLFMVPITTNPNILAKFETLGLVSDGVVHMAKSMENAIHDDFFALLPGWVTTVQTYIEPMEAAIAEGGDANALAAEVSASSTAGIQGLRAEFNTKMEAAQAAFEASRAQ